MAPTIGAEVAPRRPRDEHRQRERRGVEARLAAATISACDSKQRRERGKAIDRRLDVGERAMEERRQRRHERRQQRQRRGDASERQPAARAPSLSAPGRRGASAPRTPPSASRTGSRSAWRTTISRQRLGKRRASRGSARPPRRRHRAAARSADRAHAQELEPEPGARRRSRARNHRRDARGCRAAPPNWTQPPLVHDRDHVGQAQRLVDDRGSRTRWSCRVAPVDARRSPLASASRVIGSSAPNGSSISRISGSAASARATPTRCCWPPDSWCGYLPRIAPPDRAAAAPAARRPAHRDALRRPSRAAAARSRCCPRHRPMRKQPDRLDDIADAPAQCLGRERA